MDSSKTLLTLAISHNIYLTREERNRLANGDSISVTGVSMPVWYGKGKTTEPGKEVFCHYTLHNSPNAKSEIYFKTDGYEFNLPQLPRNFEMPQEIDDKDWANLEPEEREAIGEERYVPVNGKYLLDVKDGGSERLCFDQVAYAKMRGIPTTVFHTILIADMKMLENSLC
jgi:hypothetical protein